MFWWAYEEKNQDHFIYLRDDEKKVAKLLVGRDQNYKILGHTIVLRINDAINLDTFFECVEQARGLGDEDRLALREMRGELVLLGRSHFEGRGEPINWYGSGRLFREGALRGVLDAKSPEELVTRTATLIAFYEKDDTARAD